MILSKNRRRARGHALGFCLRPVLPTKVALVAFALLVPAQTQANGLWESQAWQFDTGLNKSTKAAIADVIERKQGGYYDGFNTYVNNTTNIGTQVNCSNGASTNANIADNGQSGATLRSAPHNESSSEVVGSSSTAEPSGGGAGGSTGSVNNNQQNSGALNAVVEGTSVLSSLKGIEVGATNQDLTNSQTNSGTLSSQVVDSPACDMGGAALTGSVQSNVE